MGATLFQDVSGGGGIRFDTAAVAGDGESITAAKGYADFALFLKEYYTAPDADGYPATSPDKNRILSALSGLRDWYIQAGASGMNATDASTGSAQANRGAFMLGGNGSDALVGGNDALLGGAGNDTYKYNTGDGLDTIFDTGGQNTLAVDNVVLDGGAEYGDNRVHRSVDGKHLYVDAGQGNLIVDGNIVIRNYGAGGSFGLALSANPVADPAPALTLAGDLAPIDFDTNTPGVQTQADSLGNIIADPGTPEAGRADTLHGGAGNDLIEGRGGSDVLDGGSGDDRLYADTQISAESAIAQGNPSAGSGQATGSGATGDWLNGGAGSDTLAGGAGDDLLAGGGAADLLIGGAGNDALMGDNDAVPWGFPAQAWHHDPASQSIILENILYSIPPDPAASGDDVIYAGEGDDFAFGGYGNDTIFGEGGSDILEGNSGGDVLLGGDNNDTLYGDTPENSAAPAAPGSDYLDGGVGSDTLTGTNTTNRINGLAGDDTLNGGAGDDTVLGGAVASSGRVHFLADGFTHHINQGQAHRVLAQRLIHHGLITAAAGLGTRLECRQHRVIHAHGNACLADHFGLQLRQMRHVFGALGAAKIIFFTHNFSPLFLSLDVQKSSARLLRRARCNTPLTTGRHGSYPARLIVPRHVHPGHRAPKLTDQANTLPLLQKTHHAFANYSRLSLDRSRFSCRHRMHEDMYCQVVINDTLTGYAEDDALVGEMQWQEAANDEATHAWRVAA